jgi:phosphate-selective porin
LQGELNPQLAFKTQDEFKGGDPSLLEWWLDWRIPAQPHVRVGHFREPFGLDARTSSAHLTFVDGGVMNNLTLGITWHLNSDTRWMVNHVRASSDEGRADLLLIRLHSGF